MYTHEPSLNPFPSPSSWLITQEDDMSVVVQHHVPVEGLLSPVQRVPPLPGEVQSLVLKGQQPPETQSHYSRSSYHSFVGHSIIIVLQPRLIQWISRLRAQLVSNPQVTHVLSSTLESHVFSLEGHMVSMWGFSGRLVSAVVTELYSGSIDNRRVDGCGCDPIKLLPGPGEFADPALCAPTFLITRFCPVLIQKRQSLPRRTLRTGQCAGCSHRDGQATGTHWQKLLGWLSWYHYLPGLKREEGRAHWDPESWRNKTGAWASGEAKTFPVWSSPLLSSPLGPWGQRSFSLVSSRVLSKWVFSLFPFVILWFK